MMLNLDPKLSDDAKSIINNFYLISQIPRRSREEERIRAWLSTWAKEHKFGYEKDEIGNLLIRVPGTKGREKELPVIIQGHLDMVCEKTVDSKHDFSKDPLELYVEGDWLKARNTSLGADNGIAIAMAMHAAAAANIDHPPLELLFTVEEETGLDGACALKESWLTGKYLLNIDSEMEGYFTVGCAGGSTLLIDFPIERRKVPKEVFTYSLLVDGLKGGHSGLDINKHRGNAIQIAARVLNNLSSDNPLYISDITGGTAHNAIPRRCEVKFALERETPPDLITEIIRSIKKEFLLSDTEIVIENELKQFQSAQDFLTQDSSLNLVNFIIACPCGPLNFSLEEPELVETSSNFAKIILEESGAKIITSQRSSVASKLEFIVAKVKALAQLSGAKVEQGASYPPWQPIWTSELLNKCKVIYRELFGNDAKVEVLHAGLECGVISNKYPNCEMISFGPTIVDPHSPDERLKISDVDKIWRLLRVTLAEINKLY